MNYFVKQHNTLYKNISIKNASQLKHWHQLLDPSSYYFTRETMRFFGDTIANYGFKNHDNIYFELYRKKPVKHGLNSSAFFCAKTLKKISNLKNFIQEQAKI